MPTIRLARVFFFWILSILESGSEIQEQNLPDFQLEARLRKGEAPQPTGTQSLDELVAGYERSLIVDRLEQNRHNLTKTAEDLQISRHALRYRMQRLKMPATSDTDEGSSAVPGKENNP